MSFKCGWIFGSFSDKKVGSLGKSGKCRDTKQQWTNRGKSFQTISCRGAMESKAVSEQVADSSMKLEVSLPSGCCETIQVSQCGTIADLALAAFLKLAAPDGRLLDPTISLRFSGLQGGDSLTAVAQPPKIVATWNVFALIMVCWRQQNCHMGQAHVCRQQQSHRTFVQNQTHSAGLWHIRCFCSNFMQF